MVAMFLASKYEDVHPLLMRTVVNKIGHNKFSGKEVQVREAELLRTLEFRVGAPTILEFLDCYQTELGDDFLAVFSPKDISDRLLTRILLLSKLSCCSYDLI